MAVSFEAYWEQLRSKEEVIYAERLLDVYRRYLDAGTTKHSKRTAIGVAMTAFAARLDTESAVALVVGAHIHDLGKHACLDIVLGTSVDFTYPFNKYKQHKHPHDGFVIGKKCLPKSEVADLAAVHGLVHHTHKVEQDSNYPTPDILKIYIEVQDITQDHLDKAKFTGPILAHNDLLDAMTHPLERPYMALDERLMAMTYPQLIDNAVSVAERDLLPMPFNVTPQQVGRLLLDNHTLIDAYSAS